MPRRTCQSESANQSPPAAFLHKTSLRSDHQHKAKHSLSELHFLLIFPASDSPPSDNGASLAASCGNCRPFEFLSVSPWLPFIAPTFDSCASDASQSRALTHLNVPFPTSPLLTFLYIHYFQIRSEPRRYDALYISLPSSSSWAASLPKSESFSRFSCATHSRSLGIQASSVIPTM
jgi:hypothetical protein